jgi:uncharacterized protein YuzE
MVKSPYSRLILDVNYSVNRIFYFYASISKAAKIKRQKIIKILGIFSKGFTKAYFKKLYKYHYCISIKMKIDIDKESNCAYIYIKEVIQEGEVKNSIEVNDDIILDFDINGKLLGIEILNASKILSKGYQNFICNK